MIRGLVAVKRAESSKPFEPIVRVRMVERLVNASTHRIALVVAPAGFGKSVAVRHFLERVEVEHIRYALRGEHATLLGFARGLAQALEIVVPGALKSVADAYEKASKSKAPALELAVWAHAHVKNYRGMIVIDDFHEAIDPAVSVFLTELIHRTQEPTRWMIVTREALDLPIASWLAYGHMDIPIDEVDLKITLDEAAELVKSVGIAIREEDLVELLALTDGWPVAFVFALRASTRTADFKRVANGTREMVYAYLAEQIFGKLREDERAFLFDTCVFSTINAAQLARNGWPQALAMIAELRKHTAFISVESDEGLYRYHELFRRYLLRELEKVGLDQLYKRRIAAGEVCEREGVFAEALALYTDAHAYERSAGVIARAGFDLLEVGRGDLLQSALDTIPEQTRRQTPMLLALRAALESRAGNADRADACYEEALRQFADVQDGQQRSDIAQRYALDLFNRFEWGKCIALIEGCNAEKIDNPKVRARMFGTLAMAYGLMPGKGDPVAFIDQAIALTATIDEEALRATILHQAGFIAFLRGDFGRAESYVRSAVEVAQRYGLDWLAARASSVLCAVIEERGDIAQRLLILQQMGMYAERAGDRALVLHSLADTYEIEVERGGGERMVDLERKLALFDTKAFARSSHMLLPSFALQAAWNGDFSAALQILHGSAQEQPTSPRRALRWGEIAVYAAACGEREVAETAVGHVFDELQALAGYEPVVHQVRARAWLALAQLLLGRASSANNLLQQLERGMQKYPLVIKVLVAAVRATYVHLETGAGHAEMASALTDLRRANLGGYARLFDLLPLPERQESSPFGLLTKTELVILRAIAGGNSSRGVGQEMERSALTIDSHVKSIVRKLRCKGRREAVSLARQHGIV